MHKLEERRHDGVNDAREDSKMRVEVAAVVARVALGRQHQPRALQQLHKRRDRPAGPLVVRPVVGWFGGGGRKGGGGAGRGGGVGGGGGWGGGGGGGRGGGGGGGGRKDNQYGGLIST